LAAVIVAVARSVSLVRHRLIWAKQLRAGSDFAQIKRRVCDGQGRSARWSGGARHARGTLWRLRVTGADEHNRKFPAALELRHSACEAFDLGECRAGGNGSTYAVDERA
jgi:hypothetical protein